MNYTKILIEFILTFILLYIIYYFFVIKKCKKNKNYVPAEVNIILVLHKIDYKKINLFQMINIVSLVTITILSLIITLISNFFSNAILVIIFGTIVSILVAIICYNYIGRYYKRQSMKKQIKH